MSKFWDRRFRQRDIRKLMEQKGMTIEELALKLGVSQRTIQRDLKEIG